jgi:uncharacterized protein (TIGR00303 family)
VWDEAMIQAYTQFEIAQTWLDRYRGKRPLFACVLGFTETALIPGISAAGATPDDRQFTALADAEFLHNGVSQAVVYPLPPLQAGASPTFISRAIVESLRIPICVMNAGLPLLPTVPSYDLGGVPAKCLSTGAAMPIATVQHLFLEGSLWGEKLAAEVGDGYLVIGECVVAGTTTALAVLQGLGISAEGLVNSSHPTCNHAQKAAIVQQGLNHSQLDLPARSLSEILDLLAAIGDPMQPVVAGMLLTASRQCGVLLAGGTQMLAVYALACALAQTIPPIAWQPKQVVVGTTRWVVEDVTGDTVGLAEAIATQFQQPVTLLGTQLNFQSSTWLQLQAYEAGFVKEGVGAGGLAIAASLMAGRENADLLQAIEDLLQRYRRLRHPTG